MDPTPTTADDAGVRLAEKIRFLSDPASYAQAPQRVRVVETHMSFVFIAEAKAYKLKKPVRFSFLDFSTLELREAMCREELRLNRRLAPDVYLDVRALTLSPAGRLAIGGDGAVVDWLVEMKSLPERRMLDAMLGEKRVSTHEIALLAQKLAEFYRKTDVSTIAPADYARRFFREQQINREVLTARAFKLDHGRSSLVLDCLDKRLALDRPLLEERVRAGCVVDGHGDLRPEHVNFSDGIAIFDALEFNAELRQVDPFDEIAFLGVECAQLGAPEIGPTLAEAVAERLGVCVPQRLIPLYAAWRAVLRARLAVAHLLDRTPRTPERWEPLASRYLALAEKNLA
jgi:aminoglycoside phosphotransferase family enzyme